MSEVIKNLFLGNSQDAKDMNNVDMVINCTTSLPFYANNALQIRILIEDNGNQDEYKKLYDAIEDNLLFEKMDELLKNKKTILCHCMAGQQRSAALIACFIIWKYNMDIYDAIGFVKSQRPIAFFGDINFMPTIKHYFVSH